MFPLVLVWEVDVVIYCASVERGRHYLFSKLLLVFHFAVTYFLELLIEWLPELGVDRAT